MEDIPLGIFFFFLILFKNPNASVFGPLVNYDLIHQRGYFFGLRTNKVCTDKQNYFILKCGNSFPEQTKKHKI